MLCIVITHNRTKIFYFTFVTKYTSVNYFIGLIVMRERKLIPELLLSILLEEFYSGVPVTKLIAKYKLVISRHHLRKLLYMYVDILDVNQAEFTRTALRNAIFPPWLKNEMFVTTQPDAWIYKGKSPFGSWEEKEL